MRFRLSTFRLLLVVVVCGGVELLAGSVAAQVNSLLGVNGVAMATNSPGNAKLVPLTKKDGLTAFEEELSKSLQMLSPKSSLDGVLAPEYRPPPAPVMQNRRPRESQDRLKEWLLMNSDDVKPGKPGEELLQFSGLGDDRRNKSSLEGIYQRFNREGGEGWSGLDPLGSQARRPANPELEDEDANLPGGIRQAEEKLKKQLGLESRSTMFEAAPARGSVGDFFGFGDRGLSPEEIQAHKIYIQQYQQVLDSSTASPGVGSLNPGLTPEVTPAPAYHGLEAMTPSARPAEAASARSRSSVVDPFRLPDPNRSIKQWDPLYEPPRIESPKPASLFTPPMEVPRRRF